MKDNDHARAAFLRTIEADPTEDTHRLAYADWLDDHGESDCDRATAEFIRVGCKIAQTRQNRQEGRWLKENWLRLIPELAPRVIRRASAGGAPYCRRSGRWMGFFVEGHHGGRAMKVRLHLEFWRGFVKRAVFEGAFDLQWCRAFSLSQPLAESDLTYEPGVVNPGESLHGGVTEDRQFSYLSMSELGSAFRFLVGGDTMEATAQHGIPNAVVRFYGDALGHKARAARKKALRAYLRQFTLLNDPAPVAIFDHLILPKVAPSV